MVSYRIAVLRQSGEWLESVTRALNTMGHEARSIRIDSEASTDASQVLENLKNFKPDFCICENFHAFDVATKDISLPLEEFLNSHQIPTAVWFVDSPKATGSVQNRHRWLCGYLPEWKSFFAADKYDALDLKKQGLQAHHLPICADSMLRDRAFQAATLKSFEAPATFAGRASVECSQVIQNEQDLLNFYIKSYIQSLFQSIQGSQTAMNAYSEKRLLSLGREIYPALANFFGYHYHDPEIYRDESSKALQYVSEKVPEAFSLLPKIVENRLHFYYSHFQLSNYLNELSSVNLRIYGDERWKSFLFKHQGTFRFLNDDELYHAYRASKVTFMLTKWHFRSVVIERVPIVLACGGLPLVDRREELYELFESDEVLSYASPEEARDLIQYYSTHETERVRIIQKGREHVFRSHTFEDRMKTLVSAMAKDWMLRK